MDAVTEDQEVVIALVASARRVMAVADATSREAAKEVVAGAPMGALRLMAREFVVAAIARQEREDALRVERAAQRERQSHEHAGPPGPRRSAAYRRWVIETDEGRDYEAQWQATSDAINERWMANLVAMMDGFRAELRMEWTAELLDTPFALPDGSQVAWGDASIEQHRTRRQMFMDNARVNVEGAARHDQAIRDLEANGAATLRDLVSVSA